MQSRYDVIIVGAGPAGACAGYAAASAGLNVLILERRKLPRYKTCGGGIPVSVGDLLPDIDPALFCESTVTHLRHTWKFADAYLGELNPNPDEKTMSLWMVQRSAFDEYLTNRAIAAGSVVHDSTFVRTIERSANGKVTVTTENGDSFAADFIIGADGAVGRVSRAGGLRKDRQLAIALEAEIPHAWGNGSPHLQAHIGHLEYGVPRGYAWIFPKANHLSIGAGYFGRRSASNRGEAKKKDLADWINGYLRSMQLPEADQSIEFHGHPLPIWNGSEEIQAWDGRLILAGDAAGMVNPLFGDGISYACRTGKRAAESIIQGTSADWTKTVAAEFGTDMDAALDIAKYFYQLSKLCYKLGVKHPRGTRLAGRLIAGDLKFSEIKDRLPWKNTASNTNQTAW